MPIDKRQPVLTTFTSAARFSHRGLAVGLSFILAACSTPALKESPPAATPQASQPPETTLPVTLTVAAVGDIMLGTDFPKDRLPPSDINILEPVSATLQQADVAFGNLEGVLQDQGEPVKRCGNPANCYLFRTPTRFVEQLKIAGFDAMTLANNHARDFGEEGRSNSMAVLAGAGIRHSGRDGDFASWEVKGKKVALIAFAPFAGANSMLAPQVVQERIGELDRSHDIVLVSFHGGAEGADVAHVPFATEYYHGENRGDVVEFAHLAVQAGADLVIGHGPHVPRALELYHERLIAYSLGNFATYWGIKVSGDNGLAPILSVEIAEDGRFLGGKIVSARQIRPAGPLIDEKHTAARTIRALTIADFPTTPLAFDERGNIGIAAPALLSGAPPLPQP
jgi:hypothetical protein